MPCHTEMRSVTTGGQQRGCCCGRTLPEAFVLLRQEREDAGEGREEREEGVRAWEKREGKIKRKGWGVGTGEARGEWQEEKCEGGRSETRE